MIYAFLSVVLAFGLLNTLCNRVPSSPMLVGVCAGFLFIFTGGNVPWETMLLGMLKLGVAFCSWEDQARRASCRILTSWVIQQALLPFTLSALCPSPRGTACALALCPGGGALHLAEPTVSSGSLSASPEGFRDTGSLYTLPSFRSAYKTLNFEPCFQCVFLCITHLKK